MKKSGAFWIPKNLKTFILAILISAHSGAGGYRGRQSTHETESSRFLCDVISNYVTQFSSSFLHCAAMDSSSIKLIHLVHSMHTAKPDTLIHFDFCYMKNYVYNLTYVLIVEDDLSVYVCLLLYAIPDAAIVADGLSRMFSSIFIVNNWISDQGFPFKNSFIK